MGKKDKKSKEKARELPASLYELLPAPKPNMTDALRFMDPRYADTDVSPERVAYVCKWLEQPPYMSQATNMALELIRAQAEYIAQMDKRPVSSGTATHFTAGVKI